MSSKLWDLNQSAMMAPMILAQTQVAGLTASVTGASVDMQLGGTTDLNLGPGEGNLHLYSDIQFVSGTGSPTCQVTLQESTDGTTWTQCTTGSNYMTPQISITTGATTSIQAPQIAGPFTRNARYIRPIVLIGGNAVTYTGNLTLIEQRKYTP